MTITFPFTLEVTFKADISTAGLNSSFGLVGDNFNWDNSIQLNNLGKAQQLTPSVRRNKTQTYYGTPFNIAPNTLYKAKITWIKDESGDTVANFKINEVDLGTIPAPSVPLIPFKYQGLNHALVVTFNFPWWLNQSSRAIISGGVGSLSGATATYLITKSSVKSIIIGILLGMTASAVGYFIISPQKVLSYGY